MRNGMRIYLFFASFVSFVWYGLSATCTFKDGFCSWAQVTYDNFNWTRASGSTSTSHTGPDNGHSTDNDIFYLYIDGSKQKSEDKAILRHTWLYGPGRACLSFWYSMYGISMGSLSVNVRLKNETLLPVWFKIGNQPKGWIFSTVDLEVGPEIGIEFEAIRGSGSTSDIALDDISLTSGSCFGTQSFIDCTFDVDACHWILDENWKISLDEVNGGKYIHSAVSSQCTGNSDLSFTARLLAMPGSVCFSFLYFLEGSDTTSLQLYSHTFFNKSLIWKATRSTNSSWSLASIFLEEGFNKFTMEFKMYSSHCMGRAGLDNISVEIGQCQESRKEVLSTTCQTNGPTVKIELTSATFVMEHRKINLFIVSYNLYKGDDTTIQVDSSGDDGKLTCTCPHYSFIGVLVGLVVGAVLFVIVLVLAAVCLFSRRRSRDKKDTHVWLHSCSADSARTEGNRGNHSHEGNRGNHSHEGNRGNHSPEGNRGNHSHEELTINSCYELSPDVSHPNNEMVANINTTSDNIEYASICKTTKYTRGTNDMYDHTDDEKRPQFESTYDHVTANSFVEYDKTDSITKDKTNVCGTYDDVMMCSDDGYDKTYVRTGAMSCLDKTYDHVTSNTNETYVTISDQWR